MCCITKPKTKNRITEETKECIGLMETTTVSSALATLMDKDERTIMAMTKFMRFTRNRLSFNYDKNIYSLRYKFNLFSSVITFECFAEN